MTMKEINGIPPGHRVSTNIPTNGDCGFAAVGRASFLSATFLRQASNDIINDNSVAFCQELAPETVTHYTTRMSKFAVDDEGGHMGEFCEGTSVAAMSICLRRSIVVYEEMEGVIIERTYSPRASLRRK